MTEEQVENKILKNNVSERTISDNRYAPILVKQIVFGLVSMILITVVTMALGVWEKKANTFVEYTEQQ